MSGHVSVVGAHGGVVYGEAAANALRDADVVVGSARHLGECSLRVEQQQWTLSGALAPVIDRIAAATQVAALDL